MGGIIWDGKNFLGHLPRVEKHENVAFSSQFLSLHHHALCLSGLPLESQPTHVTGHRPWCRPLVQLALCHLVHAPVAPKHQHRLGMTLAQRSWLASAEWPLPLGWHAVPFLTSLRSTDLKTARSPFNPATHSNAHKYFSLCNKKPGVVYQAAEHRSSYEEMFAPSARCQDGRCRLFQPPLPPPPGNKLFGRRIDSGMSVCSVFSSLLRVKRGSLVVH